MKRRLVTLAATVLVAMPLDYERIPTSGPRTGLRFWLIALVGGVGGFLAWCALDFALVRFAPSRIQDFDALLLLFPVVVGFAAAPLLRHLSFSPRFGLSIAAALLASILAIALVSLLGIPFHFSIGGKL